MVPAPQTLLVVERSYEALRRQLGIASVIAIAGLVSAPAVLSLPEPLDAIGVVAIAAIAVVVAMSVAYLLYRWFGAQPVLRVDSEGFYDGASLTAVGRVEWRDVSSIGIMTPRLGSRFIVIDVDDPERFIRDQPSRLKRLVVRRRLRRGWGVSTVMPGLLPMPLEDVADVMRDAWSRSKHGGKDAPGARPPTT